MNASMKLPCVATILSGTQVTDNVYRVRAQISSLKGDWKNALVEAMNKDVRVVESSFIVVENKAFDAKVIEGFLAGNTRSYSFEKANWLEQAKAEGLNLVETASNMYMDGDDKVWNVTTIGDTVVISKETAEDIAEILASVNETVHTKYKNFVAPLKAGDVGYVAYVTQAGVINYGLAYASVEGEDETIQIIDSEDVGGSPVVASIYQVLAFDADDALDHMENEYEEIDPLKYYTSLYSKNPASIETIKSLIGDVTIS